MLQARSASRTPQVIKGPELYLAQPGRTCPNPIAVSDHARDLLKLNECHFKCGAGSFQKRRLSRQRRMQARLDFQKKRFAMEGRPLSGDGSH